KLREVGADEQVTALAKRVATHSPVHNPNTVVRLLSRLRKVGAGEQVNALAERLSATGHFDLSIEISNHRELFRFGKEPDGSAAIRWTWKDLLLE
ncbi:hypothetical protein, partial [Streptomyces sp. NPDC055105]|uniref:hypothetical protein n=1 Tax=Streptomyces sp. NPDC055105 TaxID=3365719 RepID=UPI0037CEFDDE